MSKFTISLFVKLLSLALECVIKVSGYVVSIIDYVDDGVKNGSFSTPEWVSTLAEVQMSLDTLYDLLKSVKSSIKEVE